MAFNAGNIWGTLLKSGVQNLGSPQIPMQGIQAMSSIGKYRKAKGESDAMLNRYEALANQTADISNTASSLRKSFQSGSIYNNLVNRFEQSKLANVRAFARSGAGKQSLFQNILANASKYRQDAGNIMSQNLQNVLPNLLQQELAAKTQEVKAKGDIAAIRRGEAAASAAELQSKASQEMAGLTSMISEGIGAVHRDMSSDEMLGGVSSQITGQGGGMTSMFGG